MSWQVDHIKKMLLQAGEISLKYFALPEISTKTDGSVVTQADIEIEDFFTANLENIEKKVFLIGEETHAAKPSGYFEEAIQHAVYIVDPIDGTSPYSSHLPLWGVSVGYAEKGCLTEGAIFFPILKQMIYTEGDAVKVWMLESDQIIKLAPKDIQPNPTAMVAITQTLAKRGKVNLKNPVQALGCAVFPLMELAKGNYLGYIGSLKIWDMAAGIPMLDKMGFSMYLEDKTPFGCEISEKYYNLDFESPSCWKTHKATLFCKASCRDYILDNLEYPNKSIG